MTLAGRNSALSSLMRMDGLIIQRTLYGIASAPGK
jgi:hypothetical protein